MSQNLPVSNFRCTYHRSK